MEPQTSLQEQYPQCEIVEKPVLLSHVAEEDMPFFCSGIMQGREPDGTLAKGDRVAINHDRTGADAHRPWVTTEEGVVAQIQGRLRAIPL